MTNDEKRPTVHIWTDGSTTPSNPGPGGWGVLLKCNGKEKIISGSSPDASNIRMELTAILRGLQALERPAIIVIHTDSQYVLDGFKKLTRHQFLKSHYDIWGLIQFFRQIHKIFTIKVKAHSGEEGNERVDKVAKKAARGQTGDSHMTVPERMVEEIRRKRRLDITEK